MSEDPPIVSVPSGNIRPQFLRLYIWIMVWFLSAAPVVASNELVSNQFLPNNPHHHYHCMFSTGHKQTNNLLSGMDQMKFVYLVG